MKYDDASWHYGGKFPKDLPAEAGATHTGMFVAWALLNGLAGEIYSTDFPDEIPKLVSRSLTPGRFFLEACDGKFTDDDLNEEGNAFAQACFDFEKGQYITVLRKVSWRRRCRPLTTSRTVGKTSTV
jgi:hypothetical protein